MIQTNLTYLKYFRVVVFNLKIHDEFPANRMKLEAFEEKICLTKFGPSCTKATFW